MSKRSGNWLDDTIGFFSPEAGFRRLQMRKAMNTVRGYEGAASGRRTDGWRTTSGSVNTEISGALERIRDRSRDLTRNNPYAGRAVSVIEANVVGTGILAQIKGPTDVVDKRMGQLWRDWAESTACDADGLHNLYGLQAMAMRAMVEGGECLIRRNRARVADGLPVPLQLQLLEGDYIDTTKNQTLEGGAYIMNGVEFNSRGKRVAYWLWTQHPGEQLLLSIKQGLVSVRVPAEDILHLFRVERAGQIRGIAWGASCVIRLRDFDEYEDAQLVRQKIAACFAGFVQDMEAPADATAAKEQLHDKLEPGALEILPPGKTITFPNVPQVSDGGHSTRVLRSVAMGYGVTYESLTGDLSNVNYSSGRMGLIDFNRNVEKWRWLLFIPRVCDPLFRWFLEAAEMIGAPTQGVRATWTPPRRERIDPGKEIAAEISAIRSGLQTLPEAIRESGYDPKTHMQEIKDSNDLIDKLELILDCDPRKVMQAGILQTPVAEELSQAPAAGGSE